MIRLIVSLAVLLLARPVSAEVMKFDFGSAASPLEVGYTRVTPQSAYSEDAGFGWETKLRVVPSSDKWWNAEANGGILSAFDSTKGIAAGSDFCFGFHFFGWPHAAEDKEGVNRLNIAMDDDLKTDFVVKVTPGKYTVVIGMGDITVNHRMRPFHVDVNGKPLARNLSCPSLIYKRAEAVDCPDGRLVVTFRGAVDYKHSFPWNQCTWWMVNLMLVAPQAEAGAIDQEMLRLQGEQFSWLKQAYIPAGTAPKFEIRSSPGGESSNHYLVKDGKPFLRLLWHGWGWEDTVKYYRLYGWTNTINLGPGNRQLFYYDDWFRDGWRQRAAAEAFPTDWFEQANKAYPFGFLVNYYLGRDYMQYLPAGYRAEHPESVAVDFKGAREGGVRYPGEPGGDSYTARVMTVLADLAKSHPASGTFELFEEYWVPVNGLNPEAVAGYRRWLQDRFGTIDKLNAEWNTQYKDFAGIDPPGKPEERSGNGICHYVWRGEMAARAAKVAYDAIKAADPARPVAGAKGTFPLASWHYAPPTDIFGWYGHANMAIANAAAREFGKMSEPIHVNVCQHQTMRGGVPVDQWPFMNYRQNAYSLMLTRILDGAKSIFNEDYVLGHDFHYFHMTKQMRGKNLEGTLGGKVLIDRDDYPDVYLEAKSLQLARVNQLLLRLAPVFLPMKVPQAKVAFLATEAADSHGGPSAYYGGTMMQAVYLMKMCQVPFDVLREPQFNRMKDYQVLVLSPLAGALRPEAVTQIQEFVAKGGKLLILPPTADTDARNLQKLDFPWEALAGCRPGPAIDQGGELAITLKEGNVLPGYVKQQNSKLTSLALADGRALAAVGGKPIIAVSKDGRVVTACLPQTMPTWNLVPTEPFDARTVKFFAAIFDGWQVTRPVELTGSGEPHMIDAGVLEGEGEWLVVLAGYSTAAQTVSAKLNFLPAGNYDVVDVTGERPLVVKNANGQNRLDSDVVCRRASFVASNVSKDELSNQGVPVEIGAAMGRVLLVRPAQDEVWVNCPAHELKALTHAGDRILVVAGTTPDEQALAKQVVDAGDRLGFKAQVVDPAAIKARTVKNEVVITGFKVAEFNSTPLEVNSNLILIGNETTNPVIAQLGAEETFCFDKVLMKVDGAFPGPGRGVVEVVESVSNEAYDATANSRDAIILGGSDAAGTRLAVRRFLDLVGERP